MADQKKRLPGNVAGNFFVDSTCIDCSTCEQQAPGLFIEYGREHVVCRQPESAEEIRLAMHALLCCPTGSIGTVESNNAKAVMADFPLPIADDVYYAGFNSAKSYGGNSFLIKNSAGNWLIDSPKFLPHLVERFKQMGGLKYIFLTHRDDVADAQSYAREFSAQRIIHEADLGAQPDAEIVLSAADIVHMTEDIVIVPTPGHTRGHCVLLYQNKFLFTGDHLSWDSELKELHASQEFCWYSWHEQIKSMKKLQQYRFEWVLAGHGNKIHLPAKEMQEHLSQLVSRMEKTN